MAEKTNDEDERPVTSRFRGKVKERWEAHLKAMEKKYGKVVESDEIVKAAVHYLDSLEGEKA